MNNHIYFVKHFHTIPPGYGGVSVYVKRLMLALCKNNYISGAFYREEKAGIPSQYMHLLHKFPSHSRSLFILPEIFKLLRIFRKYKIIHAHTSLTTCFCLWLTRKVLNKPIVYTIHNQMIDRELLPLNLIDKFCLSSLAKDQGVQFITVNQQAKEMLKNLGYFFKNDIKVVPPYVPPVEIGDAKDYLDQGLVYFLKISTKFLLFYAESFATLNGNDIYGTKIVVELYCKLRQKHSDLKMIFCLSNLRKDRVKLNELKDIIKNAGYENDVYWQIGAISEMWPLLKKATILIRPTITDGDSIMIREALASGLPVIASDVTKRPLGCIVYSYDNENELLEKTLTILNNPYRKTYQQMDYTNEILNIYNKLLIHKDENI